MLVVENAAYKGPSYLLFFGAHVAKVGGISKVLVAENAAYEGLKFFVCTGGESWRDIQSAGGRECRVRGTSGREADPPPTGRAGAVQVLPHPGRVLRLLPLGSSQVPTGTNCSTVAGGKSGKTPERNLPIRTVVNLRNSLVLKNQSLSNLLRVHFFHPVLGEPQYRTSTR